VFDYGYEYQGNNGRLVVTPLTDRAYMTLTNALNMQRGGAPQGPAGTGKTETVKDLGKNLAFFVVIQNCSDQMDIVSLGKIFAGLALSGAWGCFDEFNRIQVEVLSVVASQVQTILDAIRKKEASTPFGELSIQVQPETGLFITMNPGYAGRSELPDNLACLFRPVAMMTPDFNAIAKITLMSEGFKQNELLAKKVVTIYALMKKQLSKQDHYDFGMRAVKSVLMASGRVRRERPDTDEIGVMIKAIRDMNLPKFVADDVLLFDNLFIDLFPDCDEPENANDDLQIAIEESLMRRNLQLNENLVVKIMQLYESNVTRHGNMLVGATLAGKTTAWEVLEDALNQLNAEEKERGVKEDFKYQAVKHELINPKAISTDELYGYSDDQNPPQWHDGILSNVLKRICQEKVEQRWMVLDGPVDTLWIESMNSVLDDSRLLTLTNGDRIALSPNVRLLFEVENLAVASPATVSRAGMIYLDLDELGWEPYMAMWIKGKEGEQLQEALKDLVDKYLPRVLKVKRAKCRELAATSETACIIALCRLFDALCGKNLLRTPEDPEEVEAHNLYVEKWFVFCLIWSVGATVEEGSRKEIDYILRDIESMFPHSNTVYEHYLN
jgi:dynein heavy chain